MICSKYERITAAYPFHLSVGGIHQYTQNTRTIVEPTTDKIAILFPHKETIYNTEWFITGKDEYMKPLLGVQLVDKISTGLEKF